ncbi:receptor-transporting protein 3-like [Cottoperca gobio]|uniref:Receptor-transporting protein 3-like n=1 Tax=Cottoperca gobio TaxID=56716 RepID=A0A6J2QPI7_COTGO|nr:receptor-transporting protein 3-like [Cottoperca gobio]
MSRPTEWVPSSWTTVFDDLLSDDNELDYEDEWNFNFSYIQTEEITKEQKKRGWKIYSHCANGNFQCTSCCKTWSSARVVVLFRYRLRGARGSVIMRPFGQVCRSCTNNQFSRPGFSEQEVERALLRLFAKIRKNCYGEDDDSAASGSPTPQYRTKPHEKSLCEACLQGICCQDDD